MSPRCRKQEGMTLVELLVVLLLVSVVGSVIAGGLIRGMRAEAHAQSRIEAFEQMQVAMERASRDIRAAAPLEVAEANEIQFQLTRDSACFRFTYWVEDDALQVREERSTDGCATFPSEAVRVLVPELEPGTPVFVYETDVYADGEREVAATADDVRFVTITFTRTLFDQQPVTVRTVVGLRNA